MKKLMKFCICIMIACLIGVISGCYTTSPIVSNSKHEVPSIDIEDTDTSPKSIKSSDKLIPLSTDSSKNELEFSDVITERKLPTNERGLSLKVRILKDNKYGNEYIVVSNGEGVGICPRQRY